MTAALPSAVTEASQDVVVTECPNGPVLVRGAVTVRAANGDLMPVRRRCIALCRCEASTLMPYCDGSHRGVHRAR